MQSSADFNGWDTVILEAAALERILETLRQAIDGCIDAIDRAMATKDDEWIETVTVAECEMVENLLGMAFVASQAYITSVVSYAMRLDKQLKQGGDRHPHINGQRGSLLAFGSPNIGTSIYSQIQILDALANYYKHQDEWDVDWSALTGRSRSTAVMIQAVGASQGSTGNLRSGAKALGLSDYKAVDELCVIVRDWAANVIASYRKKLRAV